MTKEEYLKKEFKIERNKQYGVGKKIGSQIWMHKNYAVDIIGKQKYNKTIQSLPNDFQYNIIRINDKNDEITFFEASDFDTSKEPIVGKSITIDKDNNVIKEQSFNHLIYHHKWLFVKDDYQGFDVDENKNRSIEWKNILGKNKQISSKIGHIKFWDEWLHKNNLRPRKEINYMALKNSVWQNYTNQDHKQLISSQKTARVQKPKTLKLLQQIHDNKERKLMDIGCGIGNELFAQELNKININYYGCDPFNQKSEQNIKNIQQAGFGQSDYVTINNVLNTINDPKIWNNILKQAENAIKENGFVLTLIYEGEKTKQEKDQEQQTGRKIEKTPIKTRDGWQNRMKAEDYLDEVKKTFPNSEIIKTKFGKFIISSKNIKCSIKNEWSFINKKRVKYKH